MNADQVDSLVRLAGALIVLAAIHVGQAGRWPRAKQRLARVVSGHGAGRGSSSAAGPSTDKAKARRDRSRRLVGELAVVLWLAIMLLAVAMNLREEFSSAAPLNPPARTLAGSRP